VEAGFTIYAIIVRILRDAWMVAPGLVPQRGDRVRSDRIRQSFSSRALSGRRRSGFFKFNVFAGFIANAKLPVVRRLFLRRAPSAKHRRASKRLDARLGDGRVGNLKSR
jgi:hypothetical protein